MTAKLEELVARVSVLEWKLLPGEEDSSGDDDDGEGLPSKASLQKVQQFATFVQELTRLSPSAIDFEIRSLSLGSEDEEGARSIQIWLEWILLELQGRSNFELIQAVLGRMIKLYSEVLAEREELKDLVKRIKEEQQGVWKGLQSKIQKCLCYVESYSQLNGL